MRNLFQPLLCTVLATAILAGMPLVRADELDDQLAQPPSSAILPDEATLRVEKLRSLESSHPDRKEEIEAYLIPYTRALTPLATTTTSESAPEAAATPAEEAKPKPWLIIKPKGAAPSMMKATSYQRQGAVVIVIGANGSRAILQAFTIAGELPWYTKEEIESGAVDLKTLIAKYEAVAGVTPGLRAELKAEIAKMRKILDERENAVKERELAREAQIKEVTSLAYDRSAGYTTAALAKLLLAAEKVRTERPDAAERIDAWAAPFREHFGKLLSGFSPVGDRWVSKADLEQQARQKRQDAFQKSLDFQISAEALTPSLGKRLLLPPLIAGGIAFLVGGALVAFGRKRAYLCLPGFLLLAGAPLAVGMLFFLATRNPANLPLVMAPAGEVPLIEVLSEAAGVETPQPDGRRISQQTLNEFLVRHVRFEGGSIAGADTREAVTVCFVPGRVIVFEMVRSMGLSWLVRLDLEFKGEGKSAGLVLADASVGALSCPPEVAADLWSNLQTSMGAVLSTSRLAERFAIGRPMEGAIELKALAAVAPPEKAAEAKVP